MGTKESKIEKLSKITVDSFLQSDAYRLNKKSINLWGAENHTLDQVEVRMRQYLVELKIEGIDISRGEDDLNYSVDVGTYLDMIRI